MHTQSHVVGLLLRVTTRTYIGAMWCRRGAVSGEADALAPISRCASFLGVATPARKSDLWVPAHRKPRFRPGVGRRRGVRHAALIEQLLGRFLLAFWGGSVFLFLARNVQRRLVLAELAFIYLQAQRIFARMPASAFQARQQDTYPWRHGATALYIAVMLRDPSLLVRWLQTRIRVMTLFQHRRFFRTMALTLQTAVLAPQKRYALRGFHLYLVGKISVTGNAMSRAYGAHAGVYGNSALCLRRVTSFTIVRTRTGCLGLTLTFAF